MSKICLIIILRLNCLKIVRKLLKVRKKRITIGIKLRDTSTYTYSSRSRENDLREGFPVTHDNFLKSINSFVPCVKVISISF